MNIYKTKEEALSAAIKEHGALALETGVISIVKIGSTAAKFMGCDEGYTYE